ncbi:MAG: hypothetical protein M1550_01260 [Deltaproteobacteria bacterium]|nr:hypothetical protein [Deltaproteobacteria bacterium]
MRDDGPVKALWIGFALAFCWPFIGLADGGGLFLGVPPVIAYIFAGWAVLVAALFLVSRKTGD